MSDARAAQREKRREEHRSAADGDGHRLLSFSPSSGIGFYERAGSVHQFDLATDRDECLAEEHAATAMRREFDQVRVMESFPDKESLLDRTKAEYIRDKKNTYYALLFTEDLTEPLRAMTLELLDREEFVPVPVSERLCDVLVESARPCLVSDVIVQSTGARRRNVVTCLARELTDMVFSYRILSAGVEGALSATESELRKVLGALSTLVAAAQPLHSPYREAARESFGWIPHALVARPARLARSVRVWGLLLKLLEQVGDVDGIAFCRNRIASLIAPQGEPRRPSETHKSAAVMSWALEDATLTRRVLAGRIEDFEVLVKRYRRDVRDRIRRYVRNPGDIEEAVQRTFISAFEDLATFDAGRKTQDELTRPRPLFGAWLLGIAKHRAIDLLREQNRLPEPLAEDYDDDLQATAVPSTDEAKDPAALYARKAERDRLWQAVRSLPRLERFCVILRSMKGRSFPAIAKSLKCSESQAKRAAYRGMKKLRRAMELGEK